MTDHKRIWNALLNAERKARSSKLVRWSNAPIRYPVLMGYNYIFYQSFKKVWFVNAKTFFGVPMKTLLPSGTDIVLNGIKSHDSEIRLSKFLVLQLREGDTFIDVGAHYGYYSLLASVLCGHRGHVYAVEASAQSYTILQDNTSGHLNITTYHNAAGDKYGEAVFFEYPGPYAEYNTTVEGAYKDKPWSKKIKETVNRVDTMLLDDLIREKHIKKAIVKIDAEGGELSVLKGLVQSLQQTELTIAMEYLRSSDPSSLHKEAIQLLGRYGYHMYAIDRDGHLKSVSDVDRYFKESGLDSDNLVFRKG